MLTCKYCVMKYGFSFRDKDRIFETDEDLYNHIEEWHGIRVIREGETEEMATKRCAEKGIVTNRTKCQCIECKELRGELFYIPSINVETIKTKEK